MRTCHIFISHCFHRSPLFYPHTTTTTTELGRGWGCLMNRRGRGCSRGSITRQSSCWNLPSSTAFAFVYLAFIMWMLCIMLSEERGIALQFPTVSAVFHICIWFESIVTTVLVQCRVRCKDEDEILFWFPHPTTPPTHHIYLPTILHPSSNCFLFNVNVLSVMVGGWGDATHLTTPRLEVVLYCWL